MRQGNQGKAAKGQLVMVNIKIKKSRKEWLADTASTVPDNDIILNPIGAAINLLQNVDVVGVTRTPS